MDNNAWNDAWIIHRKVNQYRQLLQTEQDVAWRRPRPSPAEPRDEARRSVVFIAVLLAIAGLSTTGMAGSIADDQIRQLIIEDSISTYPGGCPCPYNVGFNGSRCGGQSAWGYANGYSPLCYPSDIDDDMVKAYQQRGLGQ